MITVIWSSVGFSYWGERWGAQQTPRTGDPATGMDASSQDLMADGMGRGRVPGGWG